MCHVHNCEYFSRMGGKKNNYCSKMKTFMFLINEPKLVSKKAALN